MGYAAKIVLDSISSCGYRLTTFEVTMPRFLLAELNTHRVLSRNSASSRAIPVEKRIAMIEIDPFVPESFGKNQKGMQASVDLADDDALLARNVWHKAKDDAVTHAKALAALGVHKQLANRLIEPFCWQTILISATEWDNFFGLRTHPDAQPEIRKIAVMMDEAFQSSVPRLVTHYDWHLPLVTDFMELRAEGYTPDQICLISVGRCARVSYLTHNGTREPQADIDLALKLQSAGHMSPFEHVARPMLEEQLLLDTTGRGRGWSGNFKGWFQYRKTILNEDNFKKTLDARRRQLSA